MQAQTTRKFHGNYQKVIGGLLIATALTVAAVGLTNLGAPEIPGIGRGSEPVSAPVVDTPLGPNFGEGLPLSRQTSIATRIGPYPGEGLPRAQEILAIVAVPAGPAANLDRVAAIDTIRFIEENTFGEAAPSAESLRFLEENLWDYAPRAQAAGDVDDRTETVPDYRFLEENVWERSTPQPNSQVGLTEH